MPIREMRAAAIDRFGGPDEMKVKTLPIPEIADDEVLIRVVTAGVGVWDPWDREGRFAEMMGVEPRFPYVLGVDGAGTVAAVGDAVRHLREGDRVYAFAPLDSKSGFYAEYARAKAEDVARIPGRLSFDEAGVMAADAVTALCGLELLELQEGEKLLVFGASGGMGHLAVQLAKRMGVRVLAVASGDDGVALVHKLGADAAVDGHHGDVAAASKGLAPKGLDAALVTASGDGLADAMAALRDGARVAYPRGVSPPPEARPGVKVSPYDGRATHELLERLNRFIEAGDFRVEVARSFTLEEAPKAHRALEEHHLGKLALKIAA